MPEPRYCVELLVTLRWAIPAAAAVAGAVAAICAARAAKRSAIAAEWATRLAQREPLLVLRDRALAELFGATGDPTAEGMESASFAFGSLKKEAGNWPRVQGALSSMEYIVAKFLDFVRGTIADRTSGSRSLT